MNEGAEISSSALSRRQGRVLSILPLLAIILVAVIIRIVQLGRESVFFDELYTVWAIRLPLASLVWEVPASGHPPLYYLFCHFWFALGNSDAWVRSVSMLAGVATVIFMYLAGKELFSRTAGLLAAALTAVSPFLVWHSRVASDYSWMVAASVLSLFLLIRSEKRGGWGNWTAYTIASVAALFSHYYTFFLLLGEIPFFLLIHQRKKGSLRPWLITQAALAMVLPPLVIYNLEAASIWAGANVVPGAMDTIRGIYGAPTLLIKGYTELPGGGVTNKLSVAVAAGFITTVILSPGSRRKLGWRIPLGLAIITFATILGPVVVQGIRGDVMAGRYYVVAEPPFLLLLTGLIMATSRRVGAVSSFVVLAGLLVVSAYTVAYVRFADMRSVLNIVSSQQEPGDWLLGFPIHHFVVGTAHYMEQPPPLDGGVVSNRVAGEVLFEEQGKIWDGYHVGNIEDVDTLFALSGTALSDRLNSDLHGAKRIWIVAGDGNSPDYTKGDAVFAALGKDWVEEESRDIPPFILKLYSRRATASG